MFLIIQNQDIVIALKLHLTSLIYLYIYYLLNNPASPIIIVVKLTKGEVPDTAQMNAKVAKMVEEAIISKGVEEIFKLDDHKANTIDLFNEKFIEKISNLELPNTKIKILERLLKQTITDF